MRNKETANDYRYFPCPDLLPVVIDDEHLDSIRQSMPELPRARQARFIADYQLGEYDANRLVEDCAIADFFEQTAKMCGDARLAANWVTGELASRLNNNNLTINESPVNAEMLGGLITRIRDNTISGKIAKQVLDALWRGEGQSADDVIEQKGLKQVTDTSTIEAVIDEVLANCVEQVANYRAARDDKRSKMLGFFVGQIMKASRGKANPSMVNRILKQKLDQ